MSTSAHKLIIGAGGARQSGWLSLEHSQLDIRDPNRFRPHSLDAVLTEHVFEHLTPDESIQAARNIFKALKHGGYWRIAVPDKNNPDIAYHDFNKPGGKNKFTAQLQGFPDHKVFYNLRTLTALLHNVGFRVLPREWYDDTGRFHKMPWHQSDGYILRSSANNFFLTLGKLFTGVYATSLIVDAVKV